MPKRPRTSATRFALGERRFDLGEFSEPAVAIGINLVRFLAMFCLA